MNTACTECAPRPEGKDWALMTTSRCRPLREGESKYKGSATHICNGKHVTSKVLSWHSSRQAAVNAARKVRKQYPQARLYFLQAKSTTS